MKLATKLTAIVMAFVLLFTMASPAMAKSEKNVKTRAQYAEALSEEGYPAMTTTEFLQKVNATFSVWLQTASSQLKKKLI